MDHHTAQFNVIGEEEHLDQPAFGIGDDVRLFGGRLRWRVAGRSWDPESECVVYDLERSGCAPMICTERAIRSYAPPEPAEAPAMSFANTELEPVH